MRPIPSGTNVYNKVHCSEIGANLCGQPERPPVLGGVPGLDVRPEAVQVAHDAEVAAGGGLVDGPRPVEEVGPVLHEVHHRVKLPLPRGCGEWCLLVVEQVHVGALSGSERFMLADDDNETWLYYKISIFRAFECFKKTRLSLRTCTTTNANL